MTKYFCDRCGREIAKEELFDAEVFNVAGKTFHICHDCDGMHLINLFCENISKIESLNLYNLPYAVTEEDINA